MPGKPVVPQAAVAEVARRIPRLARIDSHMREVVRGATAALVLMMLSHGLGLGFNVLLARLLGAEGTGIYYLALTVTSIAAVVGRVGLDNALLRFTAANAAQGNWAKVAGVYRNGLRIVAIASTTVTVLMVGSATWIAQAIFSEPDLAGPLRLMALAILPAGLLAVHAESLRGLKRIQDAMVARSVGVPVVSVLCLAVLGGAQALCIPFGGKRHADWEVYACKRRARHHGSTLLHQPRAG
jgi:O-antigen/teichoic acid export membrane protein